MGWSVGYDKNWDRDIGYGVPATCDYPGCNAPIHRGLDYVCGGQPYGGDHGCGLFFCPDHLGLTNVGQLCDCCAVGNPPFKPTPDVLEWMRWKLTDASWKQWRDENPGEVDRLRALTNGGHDG